MWKVPEELVEAKEEGDLIMDLEGLEEEEILEEAAKKKLGNVDVVIERAPVCKSIFVRGIPENTPQEVIEKYFDNFGVVGEICPTTRKSEKFEDLKELKLICPKKDLPRFEEKLLNKLKEIKQTELEKTLDHKTLTDIPNEKLQLMELVGIQDMLKQDVHQDVQAKIDLSKRSIFIKTPEGQMSSAVAYLRKRDDEIDQNSSPNPS
ncbi:hypothetical protein OS493_038622 [Desmophyllum pertusum]|uniref:RRM domain-containing protein n=1 Tax=Desmophyllum pertusum TaxID=174260 RepID=A0A9W9ZHI8_9CNID|nr:hypothetical protein OS493_038622 [Desmophyllum pertusum]